MTEKYYMICSDEQYYNCQLCNREIDMTEENVTYKIVGEYTSQYNSTLHEQFICQKCLNDPTFWIKEDKQQVYSYGIGGRN